MSVEANEILNIHGPVQKISAFTSEFRNVGKIIQSGSLSDNVLEGYDAVNAIGSKGCEFLFY